jgi:hypothetical protein
MSIRLTAVAAFAFVISLAAGCSSSSTSGGSASCTAGQTQACSCSGGGSGTQSCLSDGAWGGCDCAGGTDSGTGPLDSSTNDNDSAIPEGDSSTTPQDSGMMMCPGCGDGGGPGDASPLDAAAGAFGSTCTQASDCTSMDCFLFPAKGMFCTQPCQSAADCPASSGGCNGMGQCKVP